MATTRNLFNVVSAMLAQMEQDIPKEEGMSLYFGVNVAQLREDLSKVQEQEKYRAPELQDWRVVSAILNKHFNATNDQAPWASKVIGLFTGTYRPPEEPAA